MINCKGIEFPLGFEFKAEVFGLSVEYDLIESSSESINPNLSSFETTARALASKHYIKNIVSDHK